MTTDAAATRRRHDEAHFSAGTIGIDVALRGWRSDAAARRWIVPAHVEGPGTIRRSPTRRVPSWRRSRTGTHARNAGVGRSTRAFHAAGSRSTRNAGTAARR